MPSVRLRRSWAGTGRRRRGGRRAGGGGGRLAGLTWHPPQLVRKSGRSYSPRGAVAGCRAECFSQRPICLLNQPHPARPQWGAVVTAPAQGGRAPLRKAPRPHPVPQHFLLRASFSVLLKKQVPRPGCPEQGPLRSRGHPWSDVGRGQRGILLPRWTLRGVSKELTRGRDPHRGGVQSTGVTLRGRGAWDHPGGGS